MEDAQMTTGLDRLKSLLGEVADLRHAADLIEWDERVCMPAGGAHVHGEMLAALRRIAHEKFTSDDVGEAIEAASRAQGDPEDGGTERLISVTKRDYDKATKVPSTFVAEYAHAISIGQHAWAQARADANFAAFEPHLEKIVDLKRRYVAFFPGADHPVRRAAR